jgi:hypothetical protein
MVSMYIEYWNAEYFIHHNSKRTVYAVLLTLSYDRGGIGGYVIVLEPVEPNSWNSFVIQARLPVHTLVSGLLFEVFASLRMLTSFILGHLKASEGI